MQGSCHDIDEISIKIERVSDVEEQISRVPLKVSGIKSEHEVSHTSICHY
jgi:hypothetical protein